MRFLNSTIVGASRILAVVAVIAFSSQMTLNARIDFNPVIFISGYSTDNVSYASDDEERVSDTSASVGVTFPVRRESRHGWLEFLYTTAVSRYDRATVFDDIDHLLGLRLVSDPSPRSNLTLDACYLRTQHQDLGLSACTDLFTFERSRREMLGAVLEFQRTFARRWSWEFGLDAGAADLEPIEGFAPGDTDILVEDKAGARARIGVQRMFGRRLSFGSSYGYSYIQQEVSPNVETHSLRLDIRHQATKRLKYRLEIGGYYRTSDDIDDTSQGDYRNQGVEFSFELQYGESKGYQLGPVRLDLTAGIRPTAGGAIQGTSTDVVGTTALSPSRPSKWDWRIDGQYAVRVPTSQTDDDLATFTGNLRLERSIVTVLGIRLRGFYRNQASDNPDLAVSYYRIELGLAWYPKGRKKPRSD